MVADIHHANLEVLVNPEVSPAVALVVGVPECPAPGAVLEHHRDHAVALDQDHDPDHAV